MARKPMWRTAHAHVHFSGSGLAKIHHAGARSGAAHDRVVYNHDAFSGNHFLDQIQLHSHVEIADQLTRLQKCAANLVITDERVGVRNIQLLSETESRVISGIRYRHDDVGLNGELSRKFAAHLHPHFSDIHAADHAIRSREINVFEHAKCGPLVREWPFRAESGLVDDQDFARFNFADELRMDQI